MSSICIVSFDPNTAELDSLTYRLTENAKKHGFGIYLGEPMPFADGSRFHFDLSDDFRFPNCEYLLANPAWEKENQEIKPLAQRIRYIYETIQICLEYTAELSLYISGDSGALPDDYRTERITLGDCQKILETELTAMDDPAYSLTVRFSINA